MAENKVIKKLQKVNRNSAQRFKKSFLRPTRAHTGTIQRSSIFSHDDDVYMIESDLVFGVRDDKVVFDMSMLNMFKHITSVEVRKDLSEKIVTFRLESQPYPSVTSWQQAAEDLEENSNSSGIKDWTQSLQEFGPRYESFIKGFDTFVKQTPLDKKLLMKEQSAYKRLCTFSNYPSFEIRYRMKNSEIKCSELCFNDTFIQEAGYTIDNFTATVLNEGLPQLFPPDCPALLAAMRGFMNNLNYSVTKDDITFSEQETDLLMKTGQRKRVVFQPMMLMELSEVDMIVSLIFVMKMKSEPFGSYQKQAYSAEFIEAKKDVNKEKEYLFDTYYRGKSQALRRCAAKVCKIKELNFSS